MSQKQPCWSDSNNTRKYQITVLPCSGTPVQRIDEFIPSLQSMLEQDPHAPIVMYYRVSTEDQRKNGNLQEGIADLRASLKSLGVNLDTNEYVEVRKGSDLSCADALRAACVRADQIHGIVVTTHVNRFVRPIHFHPSRNPNASYMQHDMKALVTFFGNTRFCTLYDPDTPAWEVRSQQARRGMLAKQHLGGRPRKTCRVLPGALKKRRCIQKPQAIRLREEGWSFPRIAKRLNVPMSTVVDWVKHMKIRVQRT